MIWSILNYGTSEKWFWIQSIEWKCAFLKIPQNTTENPFKKLNTFYGKNLFSSSYDMESETWNGFKKKVIFCFSWNTDSMTVTTLLLFLTEQKLSTVI